MLHVTLRWILDIRILYSTEYKPLQMTFKATHVIEAKILQRVIEMLI